jgi:hypothetical protein
MSGKVKMWFRIQPAVELGVARNDILARGVHSGGERLPHDRGCPPSETASHDTGPIPD